MADWPHYTDCQSSKKSSAASFLSDLSVENSRGHQQFDCEQFTQTTRLRIEDLGKHFHMADSYSTCDPTYHRSLHLTDIGCNGESRHQYSVQRKTYFNMKDPECCIDSGNDSESGSKSQTRTTLCTPDSETETMSSECFPLDTGSYNTAVNKITLNSDATQRDQEIKDKIIQDLYELESMVDRVVHPQDVSNRINAQLEEVPNWTDDVSPPNAIFLINTFLVSEIKKTSESREKKSQSM